MVRVIVVVALSLLASVTVRVQPREPIIDMHLHAMAANSQGPPPLAMCMPITTMPTWSQQRPYAEELMGLFKKPPCADPIWSPATDAELLRVYVMHAGFPMLDDMLAMLYQHPQLHVDVGVIVYTQPRPAFYRYLQAIVDAGFAGRVMFGSDQMVWPGAIERSIEVINAAPFLSAAQKRDILYNNAARFLRLSTEEMARHRLQ
jgi:hypothetical protein